MVNGGKQSLITLRYAESLVKVNGRSFDKGDRDVIEGKDLIAYKDVFLPDGGMLRTFRPLWWRTWRYIELTVETQDEPLTISDLRATFAAYPLSSRRNSKRPPRPKSLRSWRSGGELRASAHTKPTWTARITSSCSMAATPACKASYGSLTAATRDYCATP